MQKDVGFKQRYQEVGRYPGCLKACDCLCVNKNPHQMLT
jgi:hypothetical protein